MKYAGVITKWGDTGYTHKTSIYDKKEEAYQAMLKLVRTNKLVVESYKLWIAEY